MSQIKGSVAAQNLFSGGISDGGKIAGTISPGGVFLNDYVLKVSDIEDGHRLTITRGNDVQVMDIIAPETGKSAYDIAVEQGFRGTEAEWVASLKGETGNDGAPGESGVYIGAEEPTDPNVRVWIDPNGEIDANVGEYELIETITFEEASGIDRTKEPNGKEYRFSRMLTKIKATISESFAINVYVGYAGEYLSNCYLSIGGGATRYAAAETMQEFGYWASYMYSSNTNVNMYNATNRSGSDYTLAKKITEYPYIDRLRVPKALPAGTVIEIWGVRA